MKAYDLPWEAVRNDNGNWSVVNAGGQTLVMIDYRIHGRDAENLANWIAATPYTLSALKRVHKLDSQLVPAARFSGERRKRKFQQLDAMEADVQFALEKAKATYEVKGRTDEHD